MTEKELKSLNVSRVDTVNNEVVYEISATKLNEVIDQIKSLEKGRNEVFEDLVKLKGFYFDIDNREEESPEASKLIGKIAACEMMLKHPQLRAKRTIV